jgi:hypothetical protein
MSKRGKLKEAKEWCYCSKHDRKYLCEEGCPECNK